MEHDPGKLYRRIAICGTHERIIAQALVLNEKECNLKAEVDRRVLEIDFARQSTRRDVQGEYVGRPGFLLSSCLDTRGPSAPPAILVNGNNVGYWGNQFLLDDGEFIYKKRTPVFHYADAHALSDTYTFLLQSSYGRLFFDDVYIDADTPVGGGSDATFKAKLDEGPARPVVGISGYPLLRNSKPAWHANIHQVWDPRLLYDTGSTRGLHRSEVLRRLKRAERCDAQMIRHAITILGLDADGRLLLLVAEQSPRSAGLSVAEAESLMTELGAVDAIIIGAAGDAQLGTTNEGILIWPLVSRYDREVSGVIPRHLVSPRVVPVGARERPVPSLLTITGLSWSAG
jgi:hypothetical protein